MEFCPWNVHFRKKETRDGIRRGRQSHHQAQCPCISSDVQGAPFPARLKKNDGTTMACGGH
ncbi:hypothetical protein C9F78_004130 [Salmonella enterica subsp. enterica serovar 4,[5],12:b:-]|nr:hypothetical protein [Salmonella enterica subsp. enterica serovar 4,[5],12:b:-]